MTAVTSHLRLLIPAALVAASAVLGGSALGDPATACAAPPGKGFDDAGYDKCSRVIDEMALDGEIDDAQWDEKLEECCLANGGMWTPTVFPRCSDPAVIQPVPRPGVTPPSDAATAPPPPPSRQIPTPAPANPG